jgi:type II secretory pathway pseudopilin PulG
VNASVNSGSDAGWSLRNICRDGCRQALPVRQRQLHRRGAFSIIELVLVMLVMLILAGLVLSISGYVQEKGKRSRAETEIAALSAALESYKADNGIYPRGNADLSSGLPPYDTDKLNAQTDFNSDPKLTGSKYLLASLYLFKRLSGLNADQTPISGAKSYFSFKPHMLGRDTNGNVIYLQDPFGDSYGYSTAYQNDPNTGYNPTYDLWSTAVPTPTPSSPPTPTPQNAWIKNW